MGLEYIGNGNFIMENSVKPMKSIDGIPETCKSLMFHHSEHWKVKESRNNTDVMQQECWEMPSACSYAKSLPSFYQ